jgi:hypothetical protein
LHFSKKRPAYQVSISNKADFSTHVYQRGFHVTPNPKKIIQLKASGKQGRYVRVHQLGKNWILPIIPIYAKVSL